MKLFVALASLAFTASLISGAKITLYENMNQQGEDLTLRDLQNCTNLPSEWQDRTSSLKIYDSVCLKVFEHSGCKGRFVTLKASLHSESEYLDNLRELKFNDVISSVSPCALQIEPGRYVIQNLGDNKMLTNVKEGIYSRALSKYWKNLKTQHWDVYQVAGSALLYELSPSDQRPHIDVPVVYDVKDLATLATYKSTIPAFLIESVDDWKYVIKDSRTKQCLATSTKNADDISPTICNPQSKNQQWVFRRVD